MLNQLKKAVPCFLSVTFTLLVGCCVQSDNGAKELPRQAVVEPVLTTTSTPALPATVEETIQPFHGRIKVWKHKGGSALKHADVLATIRYVLHDMPNIKMTDHTVSLILETLIVETNVGAASYAYSATNWKNYGIAQFTRSSAKDTMKWCKQREPATYEVLMKYYNHKLSLVDNLMTNVPFCIALVSQYYLQRANVDLTSKHVGTIQQRARVWNTAYNTAAGTGTPQVYLQRVKSYWKRNKQYD
jgi:hypothetical protein